MNIFGNVQIRRARIIRTFAGIMEIKYIDIQFFDQENILQGTPYKVGIFVIFTCFHIIIHNIEFYYKLLISYS